VERNVRSLIRISPKARAPEVASFFAQLDELSGRMFRALADASPDELAWQPRRGMNTIGMLLAHSAMTETFWIVLATGVTTVDEAERAMTGLWNVPADFDGMPAAADAGPPRTLAGWTIERFREFHDRARRFAKRRAGKLGKKDVDRELKLVRPDGSYRITNPRWVLYHVLEHQAGHYGQMLLLRHQYKVRGSEA